MQYRLTLAWLLQFKIASTHFYISKIEIDSSQRTRQSIPGWLNCSRKIFFISQGFSDGFACFSDFSLLIHRRGDPGTCAGQVDLGRERSSLHSLPRHKIQCATWHLARAWPDVLQSESVLDRPGGRTAYIDR